MAKTMDTPEHLYRYQRLTAYSLGSLLNGTIWMSKPGSFNDPFDCALTLDRAKFSETLRHAVSDLVKIARQSHLEIHNPEEVRPGDIEAFEQYRSNILKMQQEIGICSFTSLADSLLMWSHYADNHRGYCVEFDCSEGTKLRRMAHRVKYEDSIPSLSAVDLRGQNKQAALDSLWLTKASYWSYESEWRIMATEGDKSYQAPSKILSVIFGARMPETDRVMLTYALRNEKYLVFKKAILKETEFRLEIVDI